MIWQLIAQNRRKSILLFLGMGILLCALGCFIGAYFGSGYGALVGTGIAFLFWVIQSFVAYFKGDSIFLTLSGAEQGTDENFQKLTHIVEEIKIASGLPAMPAVYIIPEEAPNAFAVGRNPRNSAIAVTSGLLHSMTRDELQGVVAHEIGHIANRDSLFMMFASVMLGSIVLIAEVFLYSAVASRRSSYNSYDGGNSSDRNPAFGGIALIIALLSPVLARLLYFSISRRREYLADAMAVQYTRYPEGLASALEKISHSTEQMPRVNKFMAPLFFAEVNQVDSENISLSTATHPPIAERIRILRKIGGNPSYQAYANSFSAVHSGKPLAAGIPEGTRPLVNAGTLAAVIGASIAEQLVIKNGERHILCKCGSEIKLPPGFGTNRPLVKCSHCGIIHDVSPYY